MQIYILHVGIQHTRLRLVFARLLISALAGVHSMTARCSSHQPAAVWPELPAGSGANPPAPLPGPGWPLLRPKTTRPFHSIPLPFICLAPGRGNPQKKFEISDSSRPTHPTSAFSPSTHCQTCVVPSHRRHVCRTASEPEGRVEGTPSRESGPPTGGLMLTAAVC